MLKLIFILKDNFPDTVGYMNYAISHIKQTSH